MTACRLYIYTDHTADVFVEDTAAIHLWRSQTVELIAKDGALAQSRREKYYGVLVSKFESSSAQFLYRESDKQHTLERRTQLLEIFRSTGEMFSRLWSQKACIEVWDLHTISKYLFKLESDHLEAHATHKLEAGDTSMDGKPIEIVVEPAIIAWGNERGESYNTHKVWAKAVVRMSLSTTEGGTAQG